MKKILVILTGGTIGSKVESKLIDVNPAAAYRLISLYNETYSSDTEFEVIQPLNILSENITPLEWTTLCKTMSGIDCSDYQGIIITHGTDTLPYTSALIGLLYHHLTVPVVLIASNYALDDARSNGLINFRSAVCLIKEGVAKGVFTIFQNDIGENDVFLATRIVEADNYNDQFGFYGGEPFGQIIDEKLVLSPSPLNPSLDEINANKTRIVQNAIDFKNNILVIKPHPGLDYRYFDLTHKPKAILHCLYHSSTACTDGGNYSLLEFIKRCKEEGIDFYVTSFKNYDAEMYATSKEILSLGAVPLINISAEAAYTKLLVLYNQDNLSAEAFMQTNIYFESLPEKEG